MRESQRQRVCMKECVHESERVREEELERDGCVIAPERVPLT